MHRWLPLPLLIAGCGQPAPAPQPTPTANPFAAKVAALSPPLRAGVMLRAIRDAGQDCQRVVAVTAAPGAAQPAWVATCDDQRHWVVAIAGDGTATVIDAKDLASRRSS